jgi:hypothetical protein
MARKRLILRCRVGATLGEAPWSGLSWISSPAVLFIFEIILVTSGRGNLYEVAA